MAKVEVDNDHKIQHQSFTARYEDSTIGGMGFRGAELRGYGSTEMEARRHLVDQTKAMRDQLNSAIEQMIDDLVRTPPAG